MRDVGSAAGNSPWRSPLVFASPVGITHRCAHGGMQRVDHTPPSHVRAPPCTPASVLDILPATAGKGAAARHVRQRLGFPPSRTVVCGDAGNDILMVADGAQGEEGGWLGRAGGCPTRKDGWKQLPRCGWYSVKPLCLSPIHLRQRDCPPGDPNSHPGCNAGRPVGRPL